MASREQKSEQDAVRITSAAPAPGAEIASRQRRYLFSMLVRTVCFVGAVAVGPGLLRWLLIAGAVLLPYVAVVMANTVGRSGPDLSLRDSSAGLGRELPRREAHPGLHG